MKHLIGVAVLCEVQKKYAVPMPQWTEHTLHDLINWAWRSRNGWI